MEIVQTGTATWPCCMGMFGARFAVFMRRARVLPSPYSATRNFCLLRFHWRRHLSIQIVVHFTYIGVVSHQLIKCYFVLSYTYIDILFMCLCTYTQSVLWIVEIVRVLPCIPQRSASHGHSTLPCSSPMSWTTFFH